MSEKTLRKLSDRISEVYNLELVKELSEIFIDLTKEIKEDEYKYFNLVRELAELEIEYEKIKKEREGL